MQRQPVTKPKVVEKIVCVSRYRGKQVYRVKYKDIKGTVWVNAEDVPDNLKQEFFQTRTMSGKKKKRVNQTQRSK
jgi:hypothetical protein